MMNTIIITIAIGPPCSFLADAALELVTFIVVLSVSDASMKVSRSCRTACAGSVSDLVFNPGTFLTAVPIAMNSINPPPRS